LYSGSAWLTSGVIDRTTWTPTTSTTTLIASPTTAYRTVTVGGVISTEAYIYSQSFTSYFSTIKSPSSGSVGLGTISGTVGIMRPDMFSTITQ
jgi:hypothetical protein